VLQNRTLREQLGNQQIYDQDGTLTERLERHERQIIQDILSSENGKVSKAAERLGIPRNTLYDRMTKLRLVAKSFRSSNDDES